MAFVSPMKSRSGKVRSKSDRIGIRWSYATTMIATVVAAVLIGLVQIQFLPGLNNLIFDLYQRLDRRSWDPEFPVRILDIDDESLSRLGQWPWPRSVLADAVERLGNLGVAVVAIDIVFSERDGSVERALALLPESESRAMIERALNSGPSNDVRLAAAIAKVPTVLGAILLRSGDRFDIPTKFGLVTAGDEPRELVAQFSSAVAPLPELAEASAGIGVLNWLPDSDQIVRRVPLVASIGDKIVPSLVIEALRVAQGASTLIVRSSNASGQSAFGQKTGVNTIKAGDFEIPTGAQGELRVHFSPSEPRRFIPIWKLLSGDVDRGEIQDRIVIIGTSAAGLRDQRATPIDSSVAGVEIHAQVIEQIVSGAWLTRPDWAPGAELLLAIVLPLSIGMLLPRASALTGAIVTPLAVGLVIWTSRYSFSAHGLLLDPVIPSMAVVATYVSCVIWLYRAEQHRRRFVHEAFGRYVAPAVVDRLTRDPSRFVLGGEMRTLTIMFCDVRGFSTIAERLDAQGLAHFMNEYLTAMTDAVLAHGGTVDKYIGDAVMAFWNAPLDDPDHARNATLAAWAMVRELERLNEQWKRRADERGEPHSEVGFRIGIATGECCVGNFGSNHRFDYSVLGDDVNLASRLEGANKFYHTRILASDATRDLAPALPWLEVDNVRVKGKSRATRVFTLAEPAMERKSPQFLTLASSHDKMLEAYRRGDFVAAALCAREAHGVASLWLRDLYAFYERRCDDLARARPENWSPVTDLEKL